MNVPLHLIRPFPFDISEAKVKRAGLDYWPFLSLHVHESEDAFFESMALRRIWVLENFGNKLYSDTEFQVDDVLLFGGEIKGVPREVIANRNLSKNVRRIPMFNENVRSLNLSNSVAIVLFEGLRQIGF